MQARIRRLEADYQRVFAAFNGHPHIRLTGAEGKPPEKYTFEFHLPGLSEEKDGSLTRRTTHTSEVFLPLDYPRRGPICRMTSPVFHPNIDPQKICIGDHWSAGQSLVQLVARIAEMLCYQSYNTRSPLNAKAAAWAETHSSELPLLRTDMTAGL